MDFNNVLSLKYYYKIHMNFIIKMNQKIKTKKLFNNKNQNIS